MKRYNCTLSDKRGEFGECMEAHSTGRYVLFSDVEKLQRRMQTLLDKSNSTGVAIERAISTGSVLADHPLTSRLELLANHHKREQTLADGMVSMADRCKLLTDLLREATRVIPAIGVTTDDMPVVDAFLKRIEAAVSGADSHQTGITLSAADLVELADFCSPDRDTDPEQLGTEIVLFYRRAFKSTDGDDMPAGVYVHLADYPEEGLFGPVGGRRLVGKRQDRPDTEWTDATQAPAAEDYRELQAQHDQVQSRLKVTLDTLQLALPYVEHAIEYAPSQQIAEGHTIFAAHIEAALAGQVPDHPDQPLDMVPDGWQLVPVEPAIPMLAAFVEAGGKTNCGYKAMLAAAPTPEPTKGRTITEDQEFELTAVLQSIANGFSDDPAYDAAALLKRIAGEVPWTGDSFKIPPRQGGEPCAIEPRSSSKA